MKYKQLPGYLVWQEFNNGKAQWCCRCGGQMYQSVYKYLSNLLQVLGTLPNLQEAQQTNQTQCCQRQKHELWTFD